MNTNPDNKLLFKEEVFQIVGSAIEVLNGIGHGLNEKPYENALVVEFGIRKISFKQQVNFDVLYKGHKVGLFIPDLIAFDQVLVDTKVRPHHRRRARADVELFENHEAAGGSDLEFQEPEAGMGTAGSLIRVY